LAPLSANFSGPVDDDPLNRLGAAFEADPARPVDLRDRRRISES